MNRVHDFKIPDALKSLDQWVLWKTIDRGGKATKVPFQTDGTEAKSNDPGTWCSFPQAWAAYQESDYSGIGFVFSSSLDFCGIDLDGCRDPYTRTIAEWAKTIIQKFDTYGEVSPSQTGVKLFVHGASPFPTGKKILLSGADKIGDKEPGIEIYDHGRYFAVTGWRLAGQHEPQDGKALAWLTQTYWQDEPNPQSNFFGDDSVLERARKYLAKTPPAVSGHSGHNSAFHAACVLVLGFGLSRDSAMVLLREWNQVCDPPWTDRELEHKVDDAGKQTGPRNYLRNVKPERWSMVSLPKYQEPAPARPQLTSLADAVQDYIAVLRSGKDTLIPTGIPDLDYSVGGGVEKGELIILAARPSHGKSAVGLQIVHNWTLLGIPTLVISEEMSKLALGKRTLQFISETPQEHWRTSLPALEQDLAEYKEGRAACLIAEACRTVDVAVEEIEKAVEHHKIQAVAIDYAQLLRGRGKSRYEEITNTSIAIRQVTNKHNLNVVMLCQLNRELEGRAKFVPLLSDLRDSGQLEQDADVIVFLVWPYRLDSNRDPSEYQLFIAKNRNRPINQAVAKCVFVPSRQMVLDEKQQRAYGHKTSSLNGAWDPDRPF